MKKYFNDNKYFKEEIDYYFRNKGWIKTNSNDNNIEYSDVDYPNKHYHSRITNQFNDIDMLGNKKEQYLNIINYFGYKPEYIPLTFSFSKKNVISISHIFNDYNNKLWIIKPENSLARRGIHVVHSYKNLNIILSNYSYDNWIIQEYIENPFLINNKKFHFRLYVLVFKTSNEINIYIYNKGFIYFSKTDYNKYSFNNDVHLSGENSPKEVKIFPNDLLDYINKEDYDNIIKPQFVKIANETITSVYKNFKFPNSKNNKNYKCYKLFGYDILIDDKLNLYLAEINARLISLKYPPSGFKYTFYKNILNLATSNENINSQIKLDTANYDFTHINTININQRKAYIIIIVILIIIIIVVVIYLIKNRWIKTTHK